MTYCKAYQDIEAKVLAEKRPLALAEMLAIIEADTETADRFRRVSAELDAGCGLDPELVAERVNMPEAFVRGLLAAVTLRNLALAGRPPAFARMQ